MNLRDNKQQQVSVDYDGIISNQSFGPGFGFTTFDVTNDVNRQSSQPGHTEDSDDKAEGDDGNHAHRNAVQINVEKGGKVDFHWAPSSTSSSTIKQGPLPIITPPPVRPHENGSYSRSKSSLQSTSSVALGNPLGRIGQLNAAQQSEHFDYMSDSLCYPSNVRTTTTTSSTTSPPPLPKMPSHIAGAQSSNTSTSATSKISYSPKSTHRPINPPPIFPFPLPKSNNNNTTTDGNKVNCHAT